jgi:hypothetical protein
VYRLNLLDDCQVSGWRFLGISSGPRLTNKPAQVCLYTLLAYPRTRSRIMGWLFTVGSTRKEVINERTQNWDRTSHEMLVESKCLPHCFPRRSVFRRIVERVGTHLHQGRTGNRADATLDSVRPIAIQQSQRGMVIQRHGGVDASLLLLVPSGLPGNGRCRNVRWKRGMA